MRTVDAIVYFAPVPGGHKITDPDRIVVRRPVTFTKGRGSATAILIQAYVQDGPRYPEGSQMSEPIHGELIWVTTDHRPTWDARTGGRCGNTGDPAEYLIPGSQDVNRVRTAIKRAQSAIEGWNAVGSA